MSDTAKRTLAELERQRALHESRITKSKDALRVLDAQIKSLRPLVPAEPTPAKEAK